MYSLFSAGYKMLSRFFLAALEQKNMQFLKISQASFCHLSFVKHENKVYGKTAKELA